MGSSIAPVLRGVEAVEPPVQPRVTAVVVAHNGLPAIDLCLRSLLAASDDPLDLLVVDNASTDGTVAHVRAHFPEVRVLASQSNLGYGLATNMGACLSRAEYIAVVNQDVVATRGWIERLVGALDADPSAALATPKILLASDVSRVNACGNAVHYTGITPCRGYNAPSSAFTRQEEVPAVSGAAFVVRRRVFEKLGGFDPTFFLYFEDTELSLRVALAGYRILFVPSAVVVHDFKPSFPSGKLYLLERNRLVTLLRTYRWRTVLAMAPALLLTELATLGYGALRGPRAFAEKLRGYAWVVRHFGEILRERRRVQAGRSVPDRAVLGRCTAELRLDEIDHPIARLWTTLANPFYRAWYRMMLLIVSW